jgi:hypothetical protein
MRNDWVCITSRDWCTTEEILVATSNCGIALYGDVPVLGEMYAAMSRFIHRDNVVERLLEVKDGWRRALTGHRKFPIDETIARVSIYKSFGIMPDEQVHLENTYRAFDPRKLTSRLKHSLYSTPSATKQYLLD